MDGLVDAVALALAVGDAAQTGTGQQSNAAGNDTRLVTDNVSEQVTRHNHTIKAGRVLDHDHGRTINKLMLDLEVGELLLKGLSHDLSPQPTRRQHVGLVQ